jgi:multicomponent Na+:H+ antiporter subunit B
VVVLALGVAGVAILFTRAIGGLPGFGETPHPYGARALAATVAHHTANAVASLTFDQRGFDTLGEEFLLFAAATAAVMLLRRMRDEDEEEAEHHYGREDVFGAVRLTGAAYLPFTLLVGCYVVAHGHLTPGGGFQGGVVLATGVHLLYLAGDYRVLERLRPIRVFDLTEVVGAVGFLVLGLTGLFASGSFLSDWLPLGRFNQLLSAGTVPLLNVLVGIEVASAMVLLLARFLDQALLVRREGEDDV